LVDFPLGVSPGDVLSPSEFLLGLWTLLPLRLFLRSPTFLAQEHQETGLLLAEVLHALLGQLHVSQRMPEGQSSDDEGRNTDCEKGAGTKEK
jgi:hypothetical protein